LKGHDRGTLWVACRKCCKVNLGFRWDETAGLAEQLS
jgi:hypothetical protein